MAGQDSTPYLDALLAYATQGMLTAHIWGLALVCLPATLAGAYGGMSTTPHEAMVEDLLFVRGVLDAAGISYVLVRNDDGRPVLA